MKKASIVITESEDCFWADICWLPTNEIFVGDKLINYHAYSHDLGAFVFPQVEVPEDSIIIPWFGDYEFSKHGRVYEVYSESNFDFIVEFQNFLQEQGINHEDGWDDNLHGRGRGISWRNKHGLKENSFFEWMAKKELLIEYDVHVVIRDYDNGSFVVSDRDMLK